MLLCAGRAPELEPVGHSCTEGEKQQVRLFLRLLDVRLRSRLPRALPG